MSHAAVRESTCLRSLCQRCRDRKARFRYRGRVKADRDHTLCFECFRSERDRQRARSLADRPAYPPVSPFGRALTAGQIEHRRTMLAHLRNVR
jgi:hypothetical protein